MRSAAPTQYIIQGFVAHLHKPVFRFIQKRFFCICNEKSVTSELPVRSTFVTFVEQFGNKKHPFGITFLFQQIKENPLNPHKSVVFKYVCTFV